MEPGNQRRGIGTTALSAEIVTTISEKPDHWRSLRNLLSETGTAGNLTTDAHSDGYICLTGEEAREFRRQLQELAVQAALLAELARELPQAPEDGEHQVSCDGLKAEFKRLFDQCMKDADKGWGDCKKSWAGSVGSAAWELFMGICDDKKDESRGEVQDR